MKVAGGVAVSYPHFTSLWKHQSSVSATQHRGLLGSHSSLGVGLQDGRRVCVLCNERADKGKRGCLEIGLDDDGDDEDVQPEDHSSDEGDEGGDGVQGSDMSSDSELGSSPSSSLDSSDSSKSSDVE